MLIDEATSRRILAEIRESQEFKDSPRAYEVLEYLVNESIVGRSPKEVTIAVALFGKNTTTNLKEDATVRVYINNLRKKLEHYYFTDTAPHTHRLVIPKGHYKVIFEPFVEPGRVLPKEKPFFFYAAALFAVLLSFAAGYFSGGMFRSTSTPSDIPNPVWNTFLKPHGKPTMIVLGDFFFLHERGTFGNYYRDYRINNAGDYQQLAERDPAMGKKYVPNPFTFLRPSAPWGLSFILPVLQKSPNGFSIKLASQFIVDDLKTNNVVFMGSFKTLYELQKFLHLFKLDYTVAPGSFRVKAQPDDSIHEFAPATLSAGNYEKDFAVVAKGTGPDESALLLLLGFSESGVIQAARAVCNPQLIKLIESKYSVSPSREPFDFTLVMNTEGITQTIFSSDIRYFWQSGR
ncbi:MAG: hypothetical protein NTV54_14270 [Ignavibacteriales bacterium]|nr:hypothetical protein [Ignavibacteriales bacterium]